MTVHNGFQLLEGDALQAALKAHPSSGAAAATEPAQAQDRRLELTQDSKIDYIYGRMLQLDALLDQAAPLIAQAGPMLESLAPLLGQASSPMGRIAASFLR